MESPAAIRFIGRLRPNRKKEITRSVICDHHRIRKRGHMKNQRFRRRGKTPKPLPYPGPFPTESKQGGEQTENLEFGQSRYQTGLQRLPQLGNPKGILRKASSPPGHAQTKDPNQEEPREKARNTPLGQNWPSFALL